METVRDEGVQIFLNGSMLLNVTTSSSDSLPPPLDLVQTQSVQIAFYVLYASIFAVGVAGNCLVIYVILRSVQMRTVTNYFIANLAVADLFLCFLCVPFTPLYTFLGSWVFGSLLCHLVTCAQGISIYISSLTLTVIALDRLYVMLYPFEARMSERLSASLIAVTWMFSLLATMPYAYFVQHVRIDDRDTYICQEDFPEGVRVAFGITTAVLQFVVPFSVMVVAYTIISLKITQRANNRPGRRSAGRERADQRRKRRTNRMLTAMVGVFGVSWLPLNLLNLLDDISTTAQLDWHRWQYFHLSFFVSHAFAMSSTCYNPLLYAWLNDSFRKEFCEILPFFNATESTVVTDCAAEARQPRVSVATKIPLSVFSERRSILIEHQIADNMNRSASSNPDTDKQSSDACRLLTVVTEVPADVAKTTQSTV